MATNMFFPVLRELLVSGRVAPENIYSSDEDTCNVCTLLAGTHSSCVTQLTPADGLQSV